jgi:N-acetylglucosamine kinase-like BadF-type ATPase
MRYFLGADLGGTKTHFLLANETGQVVGFGEAGPGNHQNVGYDGMFETMRTGLEVALCAAGLNPADIAGAGFGIAGYDWPSEKPKMMETIDQLGLPCPYRMVNDAVPGIVAGAQDGWGIGLVSGTGCNCWGLSPDHQREGRVTGYGVMMGEAAGGTELVFRAMQLVNFAWIKRGPETALTQALIKAVGADNVEDLLEGYTSYRYPIGAELAPLVFKVAEGGDVIARDLIHWAGCELGEMANAVIRQLGFELLAFDVVLAGSMFEGGPLLTDPMRQTVLQVAPLARFVRLNAPPVVGAVLIGMKMGGLAPDVHLRARLMESIHLVRHNGE